VIYKKNTEISKPSLWVLPKVFAVSPRQL